MENAAQASYIQDIRKNLPDGEGTTAANKRKVVGIGENQPDREALEMVVDHQCASFRPLQRDVAFADQPVDITPHASLSDIGFEIYRTEKEENVVQILEQWTTDVGQQPTQCVSFPSFSVLSLHPFLRAFAYWFLSRY